LDYSLLIVLGFTVPNDINGFLCTHF
jgi:hypothetical protein